jgi:hypothetical protein
MEDLIDLYLITFTALKESSNDHTVHGIKVTDNIF